MTRRITPDEGEQMRRLAARGLNFAGIAELTGYSRSTVRRAVGSLYADGSVPRRLRSGRPSLWHNPSAVRLLHKRRAEGLSMRQLVEVFGSSESAIRRALANGSL